MKLKYIASALLAMSFVVASAQEPAPGAPAPAVQTATAPNDGGVADTYAKYFQENAEIENSISELESKNLEEKKRIQKLREGEKKNKTAAKVEINDTTIARAKLCIADAAYFLELPYSPQNVEVAIATYENTKDVTEIYNGNLWILDLLNRYKTDTQEFNAFLKRNEKCTNPKALRDEFNKLPFVAIYNRIYKGNKDADKPYFWKAIDEKCNEIRDNNKNSQPPAQNSENTQRPQSSRPAPQDIKNNPGTQSSTGNGPTNENNKEEID